jgi:hypothetical protein
MKRLLGDRAFVVTKGGLGNQLFQLAIALYLEDQRGADVYHFEWHLPPGRIYGRDGIDVWPSYVKELAPERKILASSSSQQTRRVFRGLVTLDTLFGKFGQRLGLPVSRWINFDFRSDVFDAALASGGQWINYSGFSLMAAKHSRNLLIARIDNVCNKNDSFLRWRRLIRADKPIVVHWRRGDFAGLEAIYGNLDAKYYLNGIRALRAAGQKIWLFTDAVGEESALLKAQLDADVMIDGEVKLDALSNLRLMSFHDGMVCSNSSFSWWAAFLSDCSRLETPRHVLESPQNIFRELGGQ